MKTLRLKISQWLSSLSHWVDPRTQEERFARITAELQRLERKDCECVEVAGDNPLCLAHNP